MAVDPFLGTKAQKSFIATSPYTCLNLTCAVGLTLIFLPPAVVVREHAVWFLFLTPDLEPARRGGCCASHDLDHVPFGALETSSHSPRRAHTSLFHQVAEHVDFSSTSYYKVLVSGPLVRSFGAYALPDPTMLYGPVPAGRVRIRMSSFAYTPH